MIFGLGTLFSFVAVFILQFSFFQYDFVRTIEYFDYYIRLSFVQTIVIFVIFLWLYFLTFSLRITALLLTVTSLILGIATQQKLLYRSEPIFPSDIYFLKEIVFLFEMVDISILVLVLILVLLLALGLHFFYKERERIVKNKYQMSIRLTGFIFSTLAILYINQFNQPGNKVRAVFNHYANWISYSQHDNYSYNGVVSGLLYNLKSPAMNRPKDYSENKINDLHEKYSQKANIINESRNGSLKDYNLIFIMNETFSDPLRIDGMYISYDPIPFFRKIANENVSGMSLSQGYGGGTANIEFEALTGISLEPLASSITSPFIQMSNHMDKLPSMAKWASNSGHSLTTIHPYDSSMYKRLDNYKALGFERSLFENDFKQIERIDNNNYISDKSAYAEVFSAIYKSQSKDFIHLVTMHNHQPHVNKYKDVEFTVTGAPYNLEVAHYAKGIEYSDKEFADFIDQVNKIDEKTIVVFWGDHLPAFYGDKLFNLNGHLKMHETPLLFYTNFGGEKRNIDTISPIFFINYISEIVETPVTPYVALLYALEDTLPAFKKGIYLEKGTTQKNSREELQPGTQLLLEEYDMILYDITMGNNYSKKMGFY